MDKSSLYVLIHSPLIGPLTWSLVASQMRQRGLDAIVPPLKDSPDSNEPFWKQHADSVSRALSPIPKGTHVTLVAHSGAGPLLPAIRKSLVHPVNAYVFVDTGIPQNGATRLDLMKSEDAEWASQFQEHLQSGGHFPDWSFDDLQEVIPDETLRKQMIAELHPRGLDFFSEPIPVFDGWPDAACIYIQFSLPYEYPAAQARAADWQMYKMEAGHFHMLVNPASVTNLLVDAVQKSS